MLGGVENNFSYIQIGSPEYIHVFPLHHFKLFNIHKQTVSPKKGESTPSVLRRHSFHFSGEKKMLAFIRFLVVVVEKVVQKWLRISIEDYTGL